MPSRKVERLETVLALLFLAGVVGWFGLPFLLDRAIVVERDALSSILPMRAFLARALASGEWPMWNPAPVLGKPFLAEWQTGLFYPPTLLLLITPFSRGFNSFFVFHFAWTALGSFLWLRVVGTTRLAALLGAIVWSLGGPLVSLGHLLNHLMTVAWLPWVLWAWARPKQIRVRIVAASGMLSLALLTGSPEMALLIAGLLLVTSRDPRALLVPPLAAGLAAAQLVPVWLYLAQTERGLHGMSAESVMSHSSSLTRLVGFVRQGSKEPGAFLPTLYVGAAPAALSLVGLWLAPRRSRLIAILLGLLLVGLALGSNALLLPLLHARLSGVDLLRYPEKLLVGLHALTAFGAAYGLLELTKRLPRRLGLVAAAVIVGVVAVDLARANRHALFTLPPEQVFRAPAIARAMTRASDVDESQPVLRYYANSTGSPRVSSAEEVAELDRAVLFAATGELYGLANVNTPGSLNLASHERLQHALEQSPRPRALAVLAALGTRWITSFAPLMGEAEIRESVLPRSRWGTHLYELLGASPRAFVAERVLGAAGERAALERFVSTVDAGRSRLAVVERRDAIATAPRRHEIAWRTATPDHLALEAAIDAPGLLVVNDTFLPGWTATVDAAPAPIERVNGLVRGVWLPAGRHRVEMRYRSPGLAVGGAISVVVLAGLGLMLLPVPRRARARIPTPRPAPAVVRS